MTPGFTGAGWGGSLAALAVLAVVALPATGQYPSGTIRGVVLSQRSSSPLARVMVLLDAGLSTETAEDGTFLFREVRAGGYRIAAVATGCHVGLGELEVPAGGEIRVRLIIPLPLEAETGAEEWKLGERSEGSSMKVITGEEIRRRNLRSVQDAIRLVAPEMVGLESGQAGGRQALSGRGRTTVSGRRDPLIVVDGVQVVQNPLDALASIDPANIARIEVSKGAAGGWRYGLQGSNGVIRIQTWGPAGDYTADTPPEACRFTFPR